MTAPDDAQPIKPPPSLPPASPLPTKSRYSERLQVSQNPLSALSDSTLNQSSSVSELRSTSSSRASSPNPRLSRSSQRLSRLSSLSLTGSNADGSSDGVRSTIIRAFSPVISVHASHDTNALVQRKGFKNGFCELIRPFGEHVTGKVIIRDGIGSSRSWDDFGVRFVESISKENIGPKNEERTTALGQLENVLEKHLELSNRALPRGTSSPPLYELFLKRLLSSSSPTPHETFAHPVANIVAISSHTPSPLESLRQLYSEANLASQNAFPYVHTEYLRYYVLVHDEDMDDISQSTALFDQMKRHFGLHCHLLRVRSNQCVVTDDDCVPFPPCEWISAAEDLSTVSDQESMLGDAEQGPIYISESDVSAISSLVRELVAQSVIPHMENRVSMWNEQIASRKKGLSGRFMSISKRWTAFGSGSKSSGAFGSGNSGSNYDPYKGYYKADSPEALLRKMADYCFMLRDWKLAASTYDVLRSDFGHDKAWKYHAGAHEMCAVSTLLNPLASTAKPKLEATGQLIDTAYYSYLNRCSDAQSTLRVLIMCSELLKSRGGHAAEDGARWAMKILDANLVGPVGRVLLYERISACFAAKVATEGAKWGARRRKAGMWSVLAADSWLEFGMYSQAANALEEASRQYEKNPENKLLLFPDIQQYINDLRRSIKQGYIGPDETASNVDESDQNPSTTVETGEVSEKLDIRGHRKSMSLVGSKSPLETATLPTRLKIEEFNASSDDFE